MSLRAHEVENKFLRYIEKMVSQEGSKVCKQSIQLQGFLHIFILTYPTPLADAQVIV